MLEGGTWLGCDLEEALDVFGRLMAGSGRRCDLGSGGR